MISQRLRLPVLAVAALLLSATAAFAQPSGAYDSGGIGGACITIGCSCLPALLIIAAVGVTMAGMWKVFEKAGKPGWAAIVPVYNAIVLLEIIGKPMWWLVLLLVPCIAPVGAVMAGIEVAKCFGKDTMYGVGLGLLPFVFYPMLGFGKDVYQRPPPQPEAM